MFNVRIKYINQFQRDIEFIARRWKLTGHPTFLIVLREENIVGEYFEQILDLLVGMKNGYVNKTRVRIGRIHQLLNVSERYSRPWGLNAEDF